MPLGVTGEAADAGSVCYWVGVGKLGIWAVRTPSSPAHTLPTSPHPPNLHHPPLPSPLSPSSPNPSIATLHTPLHYLLPSEHHHSYPLSPHNPPSSPPLTPHHPPLCTTSFPLLYPHPPPSPHPTALSCADTNRAQRQQGVFMLCVAQRQALGVIQWPRGLRETVERIRGDSKVWK